MLEDTLTHPRSLFIGIDCYLRWQSIACLDADGNVLWSHFHHNRTRVAIGNDGSVATIGQVAELGDREWEGINGLVGV